MKISEVIERIKKYHKGYGVIDENTTRDKILFGNPDQECTGIVVTCWASVNVIKEAIRYGANLIICHEALFWNHGDHTGWLEKEQNPTYLYKKRLLEENNIVVWRDHDYIHSGIPIAEGGYADGIFYGFTCEMGWQNNIVSYEQMPYTYIFENEPTVNELAQQMMDRMYLDGMKIVGDPDQKVKNLQIVFHIFGDANEIINITEKTGADAFVVGEMVDYTLMEYSRDSSQCGRKKAILAPGHFNAEEPGMKYCLKYFPKILGPDIPIWFVQSGDNYVYLRPED